jgi:hypothetical protein
MEDPQQPETDVPHDDELDVEGPNESAPGHHSGDPDADSGDDSEA